MADDQHGPFALSHVLTRELRELRPDEAATAALPAALAADSDDMVDEAVRRGVVYRAAYQSELSALCLSGGGIRSASFCLGVIQALAQTKLLDKFDYLSTVSGGGYIGAWLSAWLQRAPNKRQVLTSLYSRRIDEGLPFRGADPDPARESPAVEHLREYSNYLTAKTGLLSADTWAAIAIVLRNILLNWLILLPVIAAAVIAVKLVAAAASRLSQVNPADLIVLLLFALAAANFAYKLHRLYSPDVSLDPGRAQRRFLYLSLLPAVGAGILATALALRGQTPGDALAPLFGAWPASAESRSWLMMVAFALLVVVVAALLANAVASSPPAATAAEDIYWSRKRRRWVLWEACGWAGGAVVFGSAIWFGVHLANLLDQLVVLDRGMCVVQSVPCAADAKAVMAVVSIHANRQTLLVIFGVPWFLIAGLLAHSVYLLICTYSPWGDVEREWLGRASGWHFIAALGWVAVTGVVLLGPKLYFSAAILGENAGRWMTAITAASGTVAAWLGRVGVTPAQGSAKGAFAISLNVVAAIAAAIFAALLLILLSAWADGVFLYFSPLDQGLHHVCFSSGSDIPWACNDWQRWLGGGLILAGSAGLAGSLVNVNRYSLHAIYRNRLVRAYLGGSRPLARRPDPFTGFDWDDNLRVKDLWTGPRVKSAPWRPFHVINMTLNLAATRDLAWQQRKAMSFAVTPMFSGAASLGYRKTEEYGDAAHGISLGTAMAISGAAVSSNMGYHSSPGLAFLLTLFDVRLGWWLGNPGPAGDRRQPWLRRRPYVLDAPRFAIRPLLSELFGLMNEDSPYVYLSDGGHFEDLGVYEMVRRRCKWIVAIDAGADPKRGFDDLGNAVRKIWIDLGARITFVKSELLQAEANAKSGAVPYFALGTIEYEGERDGHKVPTGKILYIKAAVRGDEEAADIIAYWRANPVFPNQSTIDQWFDEPQLEAYRALANLIVNRLITAAKPQPGDWKPDFKELFDRLDKVDARTLGHPASPETT